MTSVYIISGICNVMYVSRQDLDKKVTMADDYFSLVEFQACFESLETDPPQRQVKNSTSIREPTSATDQ